MPKTKTKIGVGFVGAGPVTQAIHLPTLSRLTSTFEVQHVTDVDPGIAETVAGRVGARWSTSADDLLADPLVDVVAVCSPHSFHAGQVIAACRMGKKAVLCEKPFATTVEEAAEVAAVSTETGVPVLVGAMHTFDPGWRAAVENAGACLQDSHTIRSSIVLPPNARFEDFATEVISRPSPPPVDHDDPEPRARLVHAGVMGLAIHDLPLVRTMLPRFDDLVVHTAYALDPFGYLVVLSAGDRRIVLHGAMSATWRPEWVLESWGDTQALRVEFTPSYVHAGSGVATLKASGSTRTWGPTDHNGYEGEWRALAAVARGEQEAPPVGELVEDLRFALAIADAAATAIRSTKRERVVA